MTMEVTKGTAAKLVAHCREHTEAQGLDELYDPDAVSIEAFAMPGGDSPESRGVAAIKGKHDWWNSTMEVHSASVDGPFVHGDDRFAVIFGFDVTDRKTGDRTSMSEVAIYTVNGDGKIVREEFYYAA